MAYNYFFDFSYFSQRQTASVMAKDAESLSSGRIRKLTVRARILQLKKDGYSQRMTAKQLKKEGFDHCTAKNVHYHWNRSSAESIRRKKSSGRPKIVDSPMKKRILEKVGNSTESVRNLARQLSGPEVSVSKSIISRVFNASGFKSFVRNKESGLTDNHKKGRLLFAKRMVGVSKSPNFVARVKCAPLDFGQFWCFEQINRNHLYVVEMF